MYGLLWRALPGPTWLRVLICVLLAVVVAGICLQWVFPAIAPYMPFNNGTVDETSGG